MNVSDRQVQKLINKATAQAKGSTPRPSLLTWCIRQALHANYSWCPYY